MDETRLLGVFDNQPLTPDRVLKDLQFRRADSAHVQALAQDQPLRDDQPLLVNGNNQLPIFFSGFVTLANGLSDGFGLDLNLFAERLDLDVCRSSLDLGAQNHFAQVMQLLVCDKLLFAEFQRALLVWTKPLELGTAMAVAWGP